MKKLIKRAAAICLACLMVLSLGACNSSDDKKSDPTTQAVTQAEGTTEAATTEAATTE